MPKRVVLAYSGGLDTSVAVRWMTDNQGVEVIALAVDVGQSTVSHHLKLLSDTGFVLAERQGNASLYRVNERCLEVFPSAAEVVMGRLPRYDPSPAACAAPWQTAAEPGTATEGSDR